MMKTRNILFLFLLLFSISNISVAQSIPVVVYADSGTLGSDYSVQVDGDVNYITILTDGAGNYPDTSVRVATFNLAFTDTGTYNLYIKLRVGANTYNDDSFFYGNGFGLKDENSDTDWIMANGLHPIGYSASSPDLLVEDAGSSQNLVWKWICLSTFNGGEDPITFHVDAGNLNQTFQIGAREDGLDISKLVFAEAGLYYTVGNLENGEQGSSEPPPDPNMPSGPPLATGAEKFLGCVYSAPQAQYFERLWNQVTPENAGKWGYAEPFRDVMNWPTLDAAYEFADTNNFPFRMHVMIWGNQQPSWIDTLTSVEQLEEINEWFSEVSGRYDSIFQVEVVNEALHDPPSGEGNGNYINALGGSGSSGWDWVINGFRIARTYFPETDLIINDYNIVNSADNTNDYLEIIELLQDEDTLLDAIGVQSHGFSLEFAATSTITSNLNALAETGLPIYVTELDIFGTDDIIQLMEYQRVFRIYWEHPAVKGITLWGFRPGMWKTSDGAPLVEEDGTPRPSMEWLTLYVPDSMNTVTDITVTAQGGVAEINTKEGTLQMNAEVLPVDASYTNVYWSSSPRSIATIDDNGLLTAVSDGVVTVTAEAGDGLGTTGTLDVTVSNQGDEIEYSQVDPNVHIYPNPARDKEFTVTGTANYKQFRIMDLTGRELFSRQINNERTVHISLDVDPGVYVIQLYDGQNVVYRNVIMK